MIKQAIELTNEYHQLMVAFSSNPDNVLHKDFKEIRELNKQLEADLDNLNQLNDEDLTETIQSLQTLICEFHYKKHINDLTTACFNKVVDGYDFGLGVETIWYAGNSIVFKYKQPINVSLSSINNFLVMFQDEDTDTVPTFGDLEQFIVGEVQAELEKREPAKEVVDEAE